MAANTSFLARLAQNLRSQKTLPEGWLRQTGPGLRGADWLAQQPQSPMQTARFEGGPDLNVGTGWNNPYDLARRADVHARAAAADVQDAGAMDRNALRTMGALIKREGVTPLTRRQLMGTLTEIGQPPLKELLVDPQAELEPEWVKDPQGTISKRRPMAGDVPISSPNDSEVRALAELTARSGQLPDGTPTQRGDIMRGMAGKPALLAQYEQTRMQPIRAQTQIMLSALDDLITEDGKLTPGAKALFGEMTPVFARNLSVRPDSVAANASLRQIVGQQVVDLIREMKGQSQTGATGFGQLNRADLDIILAASTRLTPS